MSYIYLIENFENQTYKIGFSRKNPKKRLKQLKTGNHSELSLKFIYESKFASKIERVLHLRFDLTRLIGEWFELKNDDVNNFLSLCNEIDNNFKILEEYNNPFL